MKQLLLGCLLAALASSANAELLDGKTVNLQYLWPDSSTPWYGGYGAVVANGNYLVGAGVEVPSFQLAALQIGCRWTSKATDS